MRVIGTAGHVDHGKSTLIEALTGVHPDRLKEEREREMTIDLGFGWMTLPALDEQQGEEEVGIIDVPGHRDFIENMLAGVGGIDAALFVVAADEGIMPQTREHLAILDLLQVRTGVVALTKIDLIDDPDWLDLVEADVHDALRNTTLAEAPIVRVSARARQGLEELKLALRRSLSQSAPRPDLKRPRLAVDRVFTSAGFGTVVTGTLIDGSLAVGDEIEVLPQKLHGRVRGLQTHKRKEQVAVPGSRTAVNISGISLDQIRRGDIVAQPGAYPISQRLDVRFRLLGEASGPLKHNTMVKLFIGSAEMIARVRLLGIEELTPGQEGWLQLELEEPTAAARGDRYILRRPSPGETLGGGMVIDPRPSGRHKRFSTETIQRLEALAQGEPKDILLQALNALGAGLWKDVVARANLPAQTALAAAGELGQAGLLINLDQEAGAAPRPEELVISNSLWAQLQAQVHLELEGYHRQYPLRRGMPREELKSRLKNLLRPSPRLFNQAMRRLAALGEALEDGPLAYLPGHAIRFTPQQEQMIAKLLARFTAAPYAPPSVKECQAEVGEELFNSLLETSRLVAVAPEVVFRREDYQRMVEDVRQYIARNGSITVAEARDHFNTSRKYILAFLEHLDEVGITARQGDARRLK